VVALPDENAQLVSGIMFAHTFHGRQLMGGYISRPNRRFEEFARDYAPLSRLRQAVAGSRPPLTAAERAEFLDEAARHRLRFVSLVLAMDCAKYQTRATRAWLVAEGLAVPVWEDALYAILEMRAKASEPGTPRIGNP
jgi:hypothetical protein